MQEIPPLAQRKTAMRFSMARNGAADRCWDGAVVPTNQGSLVKIPMMSAPFATNLRKRLGDTDSKQMATPTLASFTPASGKGLVDFPGSTVSN